MTPRMESSAGPLDFLKDPEKAILHEAVDGSDFSLADWEDALLAFDAWLHERNESRRPWIDMIGYTECCTRMTAPGLATPVLAMLTVQALDDFGFSILDDFQD